eukprot:Lankesteria_metandrocarpae@DN7236_c0_g1_i1.p1
MAATELNSAACVGLPFSISSFASSLKSGRLLQNTTVDEHHTPLVAITNRIHFVGLGRIEDEVILGQYRPVVSGDLEIEEVFSRLLRCAKNRFEAGKRYSFNWKNSLQLTLNVDPLGILLSFMVVNANYPERLRHQFIDELLRRAELFVLWEYDQSWKCGGTKSQQTVLKGNVSPTAFADTIKDGSVVTSDRRSAKKRRHSRSSKRSSKSTDKASRAQHVQLQHLLPLCVNLGDLTSRSDDAHATGSHA